MSGDGTHTTHRMFPMYSIRLPRPKKYPPANPRTIENDIACATWGQQEQNVDWKIVALKASRCSGSLTRLTLSVGQTFSSLSVSADGSRLIATASRMVREVWRVPLGPDAEANGRAAIRLLHPTYDPMWTFVSRDGRTLLYNNATSGSRNLWTMPVDGGGAPRQITTMSGNAVMHSALSPDGML